MKVKELIAYLQKVDPEKDVMLNAPEYGTGIPEELEEWTGIVWINSGV